MIKEDCAKSCNNISNIDKLRDSHILITGGTGFIGKWLTEMLIYLNETFGFNVTIYLLARNIPKVTNYSKLDYIHFIKSDTKNIKELPSVLNYIIHAAGTPDSKDHVSNPIKTVETFVKGTQNILDLASRLPNLIKFINISSNKIYGNNYSTNPMDEKNSTILDYSNQDVYSESKRMSETLCKSYMSELYLPIIIVRPFAFIGPFQLLEKPWAVNNFIRDAILGGPIRILGNEFTTKSYMYGSDLANYILNILSTGKIGEVYNIGSPSPITLVELANKIKQLINSELEIKIRSSKDNYNKTIFDVPLTSKIENELGVKEAFGIDEALKRTILWNNLKRQKNA
jgi:nucleoside-diphosphate-sugar epimerase